jgi:hypothetical protein
MGVLPSTTHWVPGKGRATAARRAAPRRAAHPGRGSLGAAKLPGPEENQALATGAGLDAAGHEHLRPLRRPRPLRRSAMPYSVFGKTIPPIVQQGRAYLKKQLLSQIVFQNNFQSSLGPRLKKELFRQEWPTNCFTDCFSINPAGES